MRSSSRRSPFCLHIRAIFSELGAVLAPRFIKALRMRYLIYTSFSPSSDAVPSVSSSRHFFILLHLAPSECR